MPGSGGGDHDQPDAQSEIDRRTSPPTATAWNITPRNPNAINLPGENEVGVLQRSIKKLSWSQTNNAGSGQRNEVPSVLSKVCMFFGFYVLSDLVEFLVVVLFVLFV